MERPILIMNPRRNSVKWSGRSEPPREKSKQPKSIGGDAQDLQNKLRGQMADYKSFSKAALG